MKEKWIKNQDCIYILVMLLYPLTRINQGLSVIDTTYSLSNFAFFSSMKGTWMVATYLANVIGWMLMHLPFGNTMLGMNFYTSFIVSGMAVATYQVLKKSFPKWLVFFTQMIAIGLCWAPTTVLYHYLTYMLLQFAILELFLAITKEDGKQARHYMIAGLLLGANVAVRMPNITHMMLILAVWFGTCLYAKEDENKLQLCIKNTGFCLAGYIPGFLIPFVAICFQYGISAYPRMVYTMFAMTEKATDYTPANMLTGMFGAYFKAVIWLLPWIIVWAVGWILNKTKNPLNGLLSTVWCKVLYILPFLVLVRFYWGRGMFDFRYYNYGSVYGPAVLCMFVSAGICLIVLIKGNKELRVLSLLALLQMFLVPLGGNNEVYPLMNDLFLLLPVAAGCVYLAYETKRLQYYGMMPALLLCLLLALQSVGFHFAFALQDGIWGDKRDTKIERESLPVAAGIFTTKTNADTLQELSAFVSGQKLDGREVLLYGQVPGLGYFLNMPSALTTFWPDLDSYRTLEFEEDMKELDDGIEKHNESLPVVIVSAGIGSYVDEDADAMNFFDVDKEKLEDDEKLKGIISFMEEHDYEQTFCNTAYAVYQAE